MVAQATSLKMLLPKATFITESEFLILRATSSTIAKSAQMIMTMCYISSSRYTVINNTVMDSAFFYGLDLQFSDYSIVANSYFRNNGEWGMFSSSSYGQILNNYFQNTWEYEGYDAVLDSNSAYHNVIAGNEFMGKGVKDEGTTNDYCSGPLNIFGPDAAIPMRAAYCACTDNDGDGSYLYDLADCPLGNDCNDNDPSVVGARDDLYINWDVYPLHRHL